MRRLLVLSAILPFTGCADAVTSPPEQAPVSEAPLQQLQVRGQDRVNPGRIVVKLQRIEDEADVAGSHGLEVAGRGYRDAFVVMRGAVGNERALAARLGDDARVEWAEPDYLRQPIAIDPKLWAFHNPGGLTVDYTKGRRRNKPVNSYKSLLDADVDNFENSATGGTFVLVGSIDTGLYFAHPEFLGVTVVEGTDHIDGGSPDDGNDHGTHTTGTMVGKNVGIAGVAGANVGVHVQRVCGPLGCPLSAIASAIMEAADQPDLVAMNLSLGGGSLSQGEADAIDYATSKDVLVVVSAGNGYGNPVSCPACDPGAISVGATNWQDELSYYSNYGAGLDIVGPGGELYSNTTDEAGIWSSVRFGGYEYFQGTSMSAPLVTGIAGIVASVTSLRGQALRDCLEDSADDLGASGYDTTFGNGRVNAMNALACGGGDPPPPPPPPPPSELSAAFTFNCSKANCTFDASSSTGNITSWDWTFSPDPDELSGEVVNHVFGGVGSYLVKLIVSSLSDSDETTQTVECTAKGRNGKNLICR